MNYGLISLSRASEESRRLYKLEQEKQTGRQLWRPPSSKDNGRESKLTIFSKISRLRELFAKVADCIKINKQKKKINLIKDFHREAISRLNSRRNKTAKKNLSLKIPLER